MIDWTQSRQAVVLRRAGLLVAAWGSLLGAATAFAEIRITPKHLMILRPGLDAIWGSYVFAINNTSEGEEALQAEIMLPKETVDFMPQEGLSAEQVTLSDQGGVKIDGKFPSGVHVVSIGFKVDASFGKGKLTLVPVSDVQSFSVLMPKGAPMLIASPLLAKAPVGEAPDEQYDTLIATEPLTVGRSYVLEASGIPEGRGRLWIRGGLVGGLMLILAAILAVRTRPKFTQDAGDVQLVN